MALSTKGQTPRQLMAVVVMCRDAMECPSQESPAAHHMHCQAADGPSRSDIDQRATVITTYSDRVEWGAV